MAKEIKGWRHTDDWSTDIFKHLLSDHGWYCPHCQCMIEPKDAVGFTSEKYTSLMEFGETIDLYCPNCGKEHYLKAHVTRHFFSCVDIRFDKEVTNEG